MHTWQLFRSAIDAIGDVAVQQALGYDRSTVHRFGRHPSDVEHPDATGKPNPADRIEGLIARLAAKPAGRPVVRLFQGWFNRLCDDALNENAVQPLTATSHAEHLSRLLKEFGECVAAAGSCTSAADVEKLAREWADVRVAGDDFVRAAQAGAR